MNCKICNTEFETTSHKRLTCSVECSMENKRKISMESFYRRKGHNIPNRSRVYNPDVARLTKKEQRALYRKKHKDKINERARIYTKKSPEVRKAYNLKKNFNMTLEDYDKMLKNQNYCCHICLKHENNFSKKLAVDHCHATGKVRGLLCDICNRSLGLFKDSVELLQNAIDYLTKNKH